jgi:hypothetical protein
MTAINAAVTTYIIAAIVSFAVAGLIKLLYMVIHSFSKEE